MGERINLAAWIGAFRLRTLPLALASIAMGSFLAADQGRFSWSIFVLCVLTTTFLQILSNLANDYGDSVNGADHQGRQGPGRAVQTGAISKPAMRRGIAIFVVLSFGCGLWLLHVALGFNAQSFLFFLALGLLSILAAIGYTMGRKPYGYLGLGDVSVLTFFGIVGVMGTYYLYVGQIHWRVALPALSCGFFSMAVLNVNNIRDIVSDRLAGKLSIPVRLGRANAVRYHWFLLSAGWASSIVFSFVSSLSYGQWLFMLVLPLMIRNGLAVARYEEARKLDPYLKQMALSTLFFVLAFGVGLLLDGTA